jgi:ABC-2 type transport system ATP-binding protein
MSDPAVEIRDVSKRFRIFHERNLTLKSAVMRRRRSIHEDFWALTDISLDIQRGTNFAIVGGNGSGKSTLLKCIAQILYPNTGNITVNGRLAALLEIGSGFHPELSGRDNVFLNASILGMSRSEITRKFDDIVDFSGVSEFIDQPVKNYSSGMYVRLAFSVAINIDPEILVVDEVLAVGDSAFQEKCAEKFAEFRREGRTVIVVSHALPVLRNMCDNAAWLDHGRLQAVGSTKSVLEKYEDSTRSDIRVTADGKVRWGSGEVVVDGVEVLGSDGVPYTNCIGTRSPVSLRVHYSAKSHIDRPLFALSIEALDGTELWTGNTRDFALPDGCVTGSGAVDLTIPEMPLAGGEFIVNIAVIDQNTQLALEHIRDVARLQIGSSGRSESGYVSMNGTWHVPQVGATKIT